METPSIDELKQWINEHPEVWDLYAKGYTLGLNQCEKPGSTKKVMNLKPKNVVELAAFVAAIRPGAKSLVGDFCSRTFHNYGIPAMDKMLKLDGATGVTGQSSFVFYDEQILHLAQAAGIDPGDAVTLIKSIKKKKKEKVLAYRERFIPGFTKYLVEKENDDEQHAQETSEAVWTVIQDSAAYLFNASHALAMAYDSLYGAMLKTIAPYEFYTQLLKLYVEKKQKSKIALAIKEMKAYKGIRLTTGRFGDDNRDWYIDKEHHTISQDLASIKNINSLVAEELYAMKDMHFDTFSELLYYIKVNTKIDTRQQQELIKLNYFSKFGKTGKLMAVYRIFESLKITKTLKSWKVRLDQCIEEEKNLEDVELPIEDRVQAEYELTGLCFSTDPNAKGKYLVMDIQSKFGCSMDLYNLQTGNYSSNIRTRKDIYEKDPYGAGAIINIPANGYNKKQICAYIDGVRTPIDKYDWWIKNVRIVKEGI